jgi:DNA (cytosine-5)-methyltransferase 1
VTPRIGSVYSGVLGLDLAVEAATGGHTVWTCEAAAFPRAVIAARRPGLPCYESDEAVPDDAPTIDILIGGPPCQPTSNAGKRKGADDERWRWPQFLELCRRLEPRAVFVENPPALLTLDGGRPFGTILGTMAALGFDARWTCLRASDVGAPHRRDRLFLYAWRPVADAGRIGSERRGGRGSVGGAQGEGERDGAERQRLRNAAGDGGEVVADGAGSGLQGARIRGRLADCRREDLADADSGRLEGQRRGALLDGERAPLGHDVDGCGAREVGDADGEGCEGAGADAHEGRARPCDGRGHRQVEPRICRVLDGPAGRLDEHRWPAGPGEKQGVWEPPRTTTAPTKDRRPRLKALGNAVVRQQAAEAWRRLANGAQR